MDTTPRARTVAGLIAVAALAALTVISIWFVEPPSPRAADLPSDEFSAARAYSHVEQISTSVHVTGSPAADVVRGYIETTLRGLGLQPEEQDAVGATNELGGFAMARVRNVVAVLPGSSSTGRVFLVAHYDSVQVSYGANDDGAGVSTLLETARALAAGPKPRNDIVFLFTDAEEACLCGAEAFVSQHPLAAAGGVVLNIEARGASGPSITFETSAGNAGVVGVYGSAVPYPVATSFAVEVYRILPNDTDFTPFRKSGRFVGLNAAYIDGSPAYHSPEDRASYMDKASLQHHGSNTLALARAFGGEDLRVVGKPSAGDSTYFPVFGLLVRYPGWLVWPVAVLGLVGVAALAVLARRRRLVSWPRVAAGFGLGLIPLILAPVVAQLLWALLVAVRPGYGPLIDPWRPGWYRLAVVALVATVLLTWYGLLRRRVGAWPLAIGALGWLAALGLLLAAVTPGGSYLAALPALGAAAGGIVALRLEHPAARLTALAAGVGVAVVILAPTVLLFFPALGLATGGAAALFGMLLGLSALPVFEALFPSPDAPLARRRLRAAAPGLTAGVLALACLATGLAVDRFDATYPQPSQLMYALDLDDNSARWVSGEASPSAWTSRYVTGREDLTDRFGLLGDVATGRADLAALPAPTLTLDAEGGGPGRTITVTLRPQRRVRLVYLRVRAKVTGATVAGRSIPVEPGADFKLLFHAPPPNGLTVTLNLAASGPVEIRAMDGSDGLDGLPGFVPRPPDLGVQGTHVSELVLVAKTYTI